MILLSTLFSLVGFFALCLTMDRHHQTVFGEGPTPGRRRILRGFGVAGLVASAATAVRGLGLTDGIVAWPGLLTLGATIVLLTLTYRPVRPPRRTDP